MARVTAGTGAARQPLAHTLRPRTLGEFIGQVKIVGPDTPLGRAIREDSVHSVILAGPPGTGKTTLAAIIAESTKAHFTKLNAVLSGVKELKEVCSDAKQRFEKFHQRTVLFIDEIHRFNKSQQDALLPFVEEGTVILIGATTANPYFEVNSALVSRSFVCLLEPLSQEDLILILRRALVHPDGYAGKITIDDAALARIAQVSNGDARIALNCLELAVMTAGKKLTTAQIEALFRDRARRHDKTGEEHYNVISAFIKSMRGSDPDAALVWLFSMIEGGEDPRFLFRRMLIFASEDIGNADPQALQLVSSAWQAFELTGLPEGEFFLAHACIYLAQAPKSNAVKIAKDRVKSYLRSIPQTEVPLHLRNAPVKGMKEQGFGKGYQYPHNAEGAIVAEHYFPIGEQPRTFYEPTDRGQETEIRKRMAKTKVVLRG